MTTRDIKSALVDIIQYNYYWPDAESGDAVYGFTHSKEVNCICRDMLPPHTVTPFEKAVLEEPWRIICNGAAPARRTQTGSGLGWTECRTR